MKHEKGHYQFYNMTTQSVDLRVQALELELKVLKTELDARLQTMQDMLEAVIMRAS
jgi:hypothetical protein